MCCDYDLSSHFLSFIHLYVFRILSFMQFCRADVFHRHAFVQSQFARMVALCRYVPSPVKQMVEDKLVNHCGLTITYLDYFGGFPSLTPNDNSIFAF